MDMDCLCNYGGYFGGDGMKTLVVIQARMGSTRLPKKAMMNLLGKPMLEHVVRRCQAADVGQVIVATTMCLADLAILRCTKRLGVDCYMGHETNVLFRYYMAAKKFQADHIVRVTADCPMIDPAVIKRTVDWYFEKKPDFCSARLDPKAYPDGMDVEIMKFELLQAAVENATEQYEFEHVTPWIFNMGIYECINTPSERVWDEGVKFSVDTKEDYFLVKKICQELYPKNPLFGLEEILEVYEHISVKVTKNADNTRS